MSKGGHKLIILTINIKIHFMAIIWVDGQYWIWKTSFSVKYAKDFMKKYWNKWLIISNVKLYWPEFKNYIHYDDSNIIDVLRFLNYVNDKDRENKNNYYTNRFWKKEYKRNNFSKFLIIFDESWALLNKHQKQMFNSVLLQYVNQTRKINYDMLLTSVLWDENFKQLRDKVWFWFTLKRPFWEETPLLSWITTVYREQRESDWVTVKTKKFIWKDLKGDRVVKELPLISYFWWFYKPFTYNYYDDLYKNIDDKVTYQEMQSIIQKLKVPKFIIEKYNLK